MDAETMRKKIMELTLGIRDESGLSPEDINTLDRLEKEIAEAVKKGMIIEIPPEFPD